MKKLIFLLLLFVCFYSYGQVYQAMPQPGYGPIKRIIVDSVLIIPKGTSSLRNLTGITNTGSLRYNESDSSLYVYTGNQFLKQARSADKVDSLTRTPGIDSIYIWKNGTSTAILDSTGGGATPTWQQTLTAGSTLNQYNEIDGGSYSFVWENMGTFQVNGVGTTSGVTFAASVGDSTSTFVVTPGGFTVRPYDGNFIVDSLNYQNNANDSMVVWNPSTGDVGMRAIPTGGSGITVGTTTITSGTNGRVGYNNSGVYGEYPITGTGNVVMSASPTLSGTATIPSVDLTSGSTTGIKVGGTIRWYDDGSKIRQSPSGGVYQQYTAGSNADHYIFDLSGSNYLRTHILGGTRSLIESSVTMAIQPTGGTTSIGGTTVDSPLTVNGSAHITGYLKVDTDPLIYEALVTETGGVQSAIVLKNTTGVTFTLSSADAGVIKIDADSGTPFTANKTLVYVSMNSDGNAPPSFTYSANYTHVDNTRVEINTFSDGIAASNIAANMSVKIVIYP